MKIKSGDPVLVVNSFSTGDAIVEAVEEGTVLHIFDDGKLIVSTENDGPRMYDPDKVELNLAAVVPDAVVDLLRIFPNKMPSPSSPLQVSEEDYRIIATTVPLLRRALADHPYLVNRRKQLNHIQRVEHKIFEAFGNVMDKVEAYFDGARQSL